MVSDRLVKIARVLKVQRQLHKMAEVRLADLEQRKRDLESAQVHLIETLNNDENLHGLFVDSTAKRLQRLAGQTSEVAAARVAQRETTLDWAMQVKRSEKLAATLGEEKRRAVEKKSLQAILEASFSTGRKPPES